MEKSQTSIMLAVDLCLLTAPALPSPTGPSPLHLLQPPRQAAETALVRTLVRAPSRRVRGYSIPNLRFRF
jgi:hypothetical protein